MNDYIHFQIKNGDKVIFNGSVGDLDIASLRIYSLIKGINQQDLAFKLNDYTKKAICEIVQEVLTK